MRRALIAWNVLLSLALVVSATGAADVAVTRGPYLQRAAVDEIVIRWRTDVPTDARVTWGVAPDALDQATISTVLSTEHVVYVQGLAADTRYYYAIGTSTEVLAGADFDHYFETNPPTGSTTGFRIWVVGDSGAANDRAVEVREAFRQLNGWLSPDLWLMLGDNAYPDGNDAAYQAAVFDMYPELLRNTTLWPTRGNHDVLHAGDNNDYYELFSLPTLGQCGGVPSGSEAYYSFDYGNLHVVCLDSEGVSRSPTGAMLTWLAEDLAASSQTWTIAFFHHPPYSKGSHDSDDVTDSEGKMRDMRENALPILEAGGVDLVLTGHSHAYERSYLLDGHYGHSSTLVGSMILDGGDGRPAGDGAYMKPAAAPTPNDGAVYVVTGSASRLQGGDFDHPAIHTHVLDFGSVVVDVSGPLLRAQMIDRGPVVRDEFVILKGDIVVAVPEDTDSAVGPWIRASSARSDGARLVIGLDARRSVELGIFGVDGRRVRRVANVTKAAGRHEFHWNGRDDAGRDVSPGVYLAVLRAGAELRAARVVLLGR